MNELVTGRRRVSASEARCRADSCTALLMTGCTSTSVVDGRATSMLFNPDRVGGLPVTDGPSGPRANAPPTEGTVEDTDNGPMDHLALLAVNDIQDFWTKNYANYLPGNFEPVDTLRPYDSTIRRVRRFAGRIRIKAPMRRSASSSTR